MRLQNLVLTTNVAGIKILTCTNEDIMDNMKLYLRQGVSQYTVTGVKTGNVYKFTFPVLDFGIVRMQFVSTRGTQVRASTIFSTMIEDNVVSKPGNEYAKATDLTAVDDKYKIITDNLTGSLNLHKTNYNTFHDDQIIFNNNTTTDISNYKLTTNTSITNINTTLNGMYTKTEVNTLISNTNSSVDTKLQSYYNKTEVDNKLATLDLTNYAPKSTVYTKSETNALFTHYYTKTNVDDKFVLYYTKSNVDSLFANDRLSNDGRYVLKDVYDTYTSTIYTKTEIDNKVSNINTQITGLTNNINTLNTTVGDNYTNLDAKYVALNTKVENYNSTQTTNLNAYKTLSAEILNRQNVISLKDEELALLADKLLVQTQIHQKMVEEFDITKVKIKNLTGIKLNVIAKLREKLGKSINIDEKSGAIKFSSNILFDQNEYKLKEESKKELSIVLKKYLNTLVGDKEMRKFIESITIEGHTNSDGSYLSNLQLSQQRALAVMQFLYDSNIIDKNLLSTYVNSSGRSSSDLILDKNGVEDKDASRRIEIKFAIKNEEAVKELQNFLGDKK